MSNVDLDRRILTVTGATAKSRRAGHIPLNREATSVLLKWSEQSEDTSGLVFVNERGERLDRANSSWRRAADRLDLVVEPSPASRAVSTCIVPPESSRHPPTAIPVIPLRKIGSSAACQPDRRSAARQYFLLSDR